MSILKKEYYLSDRVVDLAKNLLGKVICTSIDGELSSGIICETEAYAGVTDKGSHAYGNKRTQRTEVMFAEGGIAYVYLCYGMHSLFNIVTSVADEPHAVLIRGIIPLEGKMVMASRKSLSQLTFKHTTGPGNVTKALGIGMKHNRICLYNRELADKQDSIWLKDEGITINKNDFNAGPRIGIAYAEEDAYLPYRFVLNAQTINRFL